MPKYRCDRCGGIFTSTKSFNILDKAYCPDCKKGKMFRAFSPHVNPSAFAYNPYSSINQNSKAYDILKFIGQTNGVRYKDIIFNFAHKRRYSNDKDILTASDYHTLYVDSILRKLELSGLVARKKRGLYKITNEGTDVIIQLENKDYFTGDNIWRPYWKLNEIDEKTRTKLRCVRCDTIYNESELAEFSFCPNCGETDETSEVVNVKKRKR